MANGDIASPAGLDVEPRRSGRPAVDVNREARTARIVFWAIPIAFIMLVVGSRLVLTSRPAKRAMAVRVASEIANRTKAAVRLGGIDFGWAYQPCIQRAEIYRIHGQFEVNATTQEACVDRWPSAVGSGFRAVRIRLTHPSLRLVGSRPVGGGDSLAEVEPTRTASAGPGTAEAHAPLREVEVVFDDLRLDWSSMPFPKRVADGSFGPIDGRITLQRRGDLSAVSIAINEPRTGMAITGRANPTPSGWDLAATLEGDLAPSFGPLLSAAGLDIRKLPVHGVAGVVYSTRDNRITIDLNLSQYDVDLSNELVSNQRLVGFQAREKIRIHIDINEQRIWVEDGLVEVNGVAGVLNVDVRTKGESPTFLVGAELKTVSIAKLLRSIPGTDFPSALNDLSAGALFALAFTISGKLKDPATWQPKIEHRLVGIERGGSGLDYLRQPFAFRPLTKTGRADKPLTVGPGTTSWVRYAQIPYAQRRAIQVAEDANFFLHNGVDVEEIRAALVHTLTTGERVRGGSTLTQQLVKNLFLTRDRTAMRKVQEVFLTFLLESAMDKDELFALYANIIEWGPGIYGLRAAAYYYFGEAPAKLTLKQMAYLATIIPGPLLFHKFYEQGWVPPSHLAKVDLLLERLHKLGTIKTQEELDEALAAKVTFTKRSGVTAVRAPKEVPPP